MKIRKTLLVCCALIALGVALYTVRGSSSLPKEEVKTAVSPVSQKQAKKDVEQSKRIALSVNLDPEFAP